MLNYEKVGGCIGVLNGFNAYFSYNRSNLELISAYDNMPLLLTKVIGYFPFLSGFIEELGVFKVLFFLTGSFYDILLKELLSLVFISYSSNLNWYMFFLIFGSEMCAKN